MTRASIVIPTRARPAYLEVALASLAEAAVGEDAEILVVDDAGPSPAMAALAARHGARYEPHHEPLGLNVARNTGVERSGGPLVLFLDDDVRVGARWLGALLGAAAEHPDVDVFTGPIRASLEGGGPRSCGREGPPITTLELGPEDTDAEFAWGANMAIRRSALERVGPFDTTLADGGDEQEWQERLRALKPGARVLYVAHAGVEHRRAGADASLVSLARGARARGRAARRFDSRRRSAPSLGRELSTLARCCGHVVRRRCPAGLTSVAHSAGRLGEGLRERRAGAPPALPRPPGEDFLSGASGAVGGLGSARRRAGDLALDGWRRLNGEGARLARAAAAWPPPRRVLALGVRRPENARLADAIAAELRSSRHAVELHTCPPGGLGKFENLNRLLGEHPAAGHDWLLLIDDDIELPPGFLDRFVFLCERFSLALAQPAHRLDSHAAWAVTRRRRASAVRETRFVEIGPVTAFAAVTFAELLPFPPLRMGWGLDLHWAALAGDRGWRCGITDAVAVRHRSAPAAAAYARREAVEEARAFLASRRYVTAGEAERTLTTHRRW